MKFYPIITLIGAVALLFIGCRKDRTGNLETTAVLGKANLKVIHVSPYTTNYNTQLRINTVRVSGILPYNTPFPGGGLNTGGSNMPWYMALHPGPTFINLTVPKVGTDIDSIALTTKVTELQADNYYSAYLTDTAANTQLVVVKENVTMPDNNTSRFKFVNLMPNQAALDLYFAGVKVASATPYKGTSPEFLLPYRATGQWAIRIAGAAPTSTALAVYPTTGSVTIPNQRIMTVFSRGYSGATLNRAPGISLIYNNK